MPDSFSPLEMPAAVADRLAMGLAGLLGHQSAELAGAIDRWAGRLGEQMQALEAILAGDAAAGTPTTPAGAATPGGAATLGGAATSGAAAAPGGAARPAPDDRPPIAGGPGAPQLDHPAAAVSPPELQCAPVATYDLAASWAGWTFHQGVRMRPGGWVELAQEHSTPGVVSAPVDLPQGGLYRLVVNAAAQLPGAVTRLHIRATDGGREALGPDIALSSETSESFLFVPHRVRRMSIFVVAFHPKAGFRFQLTRVSLERVDPESYYRRTRHGAATPLIASMASIPARARMMRDAVESLLLQCDRVRVFLNEYPAVPPFLRHERIELRRSQDWDDKGDAGKFGWIDAGDPPGFRLIADDDLIFSPDFAERMIQTLAGYGNRAIAGMHGVLLRQPVTNYYDPAARTVHYFQNHLSEDATVHVLGTNAMLYHSACVTLRWDDFMFRNMADIFLARHAQEQAIPMIAVRRPRAWVRQNSQDGGFETIYDSSLQRKRTRFDSSAVQDAVVRAIAPLTMQPTSRPKLALLLLASAPAAFDAALDSWRRTRWAMFDWVVIVVAAADDAALVAHVARASAPCELHVAGDAAMPAIARVDAAFALLRRLGTRMACVAVDSVRFVHGGWARLLVGRLGGAAPAYLFAGATADGALQPGGWDPARVPGIAWLDTRLLAAPAAGLAASVAERLAQTLSGGLPQGRLLDLGEERDKLASMLSFEDCEAALAVLAAASSPAPPPPPCRASPALPPLAVHDLFARVLVINLDRRPDRLEQVRAGLAAAGITAERFAAVDGRTPAVAEEFAAYSATPLTVVGEGPRPVRGSRDYYLDYDSQRARVAYLEARLGRKAIETAGAWAYLQSWEAILEQALADRVPALLVFDDDVVMHRRAPALFAAAVAGLPDNWMILQLGTLQYHWTPDWITQRTRFLYSTNGSAIGSHAVGVRFDAIPFLLEHVKRRELPFDTGALAAATRAFADRSFVITPNLAIQRLDDTDIASSPFQRNKTLADVAGTYRWAIEDYHL